MNESTIFRRGLPTLLLYCIPLLATYLLVMLFLNNEEGVERFFETVRNANPTLTAFVAQFSRYGAVPLYVVFVLMLCFGIKQGSHSLLRFICRFLLLLVVTVFLVELTKVVTGRPRPPTDGSFQPFSFHRSHQSFPSAHVAESLALGAPLCLRYGHQIMAAFLGLFPALMALSRLYLGQHHPSDFLGSIMVFLVSYLFVRRLTGGNFFARVGLTAR